MLGHRRQGRVTADQARRFAQETLGKIADGEASAAGRARSRTVPTLAEAFKGYLAAGPRREAIQGVIGGA